jgi:excinuclease ABC subunit C
VLAQSIPFTPESDAVAFAQVPAASGVFVLRPNEANAEPYVSKSSNIRRRIARLLARPEEAGYSKRLNLRERCAAIEFTQTGSDFENTLLLYRVLRAHFPKTYTKRLRLSPASLIKINWENAYPRAYVTSKLGRLDGPSHYFGPFRSRTVAEKYANDVLDLFKSRRCTFELNPDPAFPGCVYSEMKMCLAPCFKDCTDEEYMAEVRRVEEFFASQGESMIAPLAASRDEASEKLEFESAKTLHERVEKLKSVARESDEMVRRVDELDCVIVQPGVEGVNLFRFNAGQMCGPVNVSTDETPVIRDAPEHDADAGGPPAEQPASRRRYQSDSLQNALDLLKGTKKISASECSEHLAILKRWYYRSNKVGEIVFRNVDGSWPVRKLANACERATSPRRHGDTEEIGPSIKHPEHSEGSL